MKKISVLGAIFGMTLIGSAFGADVTIYYSPSCPHCHHARDFLSNTLVYENHDITVTQVNVADAANRQMFIDVLKKCEYESGGVPVLVVGDKCFQGYAEFMQDEIRDAALVGLSDDAKATVEANKKAMSADSESFKQQHASRASAIVEYTPDAVKADEVKTEKKNNIVYFWAILIVLVAALGFVLVKRDNKK